MYIVQPNERTNSQSSLKTILYSFQNDLFYVTSVANYLSLKFPSVFYQFAQYQKFTPESLPSQSD
jgi:hypothetical protein